MSINYFEKNYSASMSGSNVPDIIKVKKRSGDDWCDIEMSIHDETTGRIQIRSKEQTEQLHFLLGQMLST